MERFFRTSLAIFTMLFMAALLTTACSDDSPSEPDNNNPDDTTGNNDTNNTSITEKVRPVVFVHGYLEAADVYTQMCQLFEANGYQQSHLRSFDFVSYFTSNGSEADLDAMTQQLKAQVENVLQATGADRVDLVAHALGAQAVQRYLVQQGGTANVAHVVMLGGIIDASISFNGDVTPPPCEYLTVRSDGNDATQNSNGSAGQMVGADNRQYPGFDNLQLSSDPTVFERMYTFFTGEAPAVTAMPRSKVGQEYVLTGKVIDFFDNTPIANAMVIVTPIRQKSDGTIERQSGSLATQSTGPDGSFSAAITPGLEQYFELRVVVTTKSHYDMHIYRQPFRANSAWERLRLVPRSGGSALLSDFSSALRTGGHAITILHSQNSTFISSKHSVKVRKYDPQFTLLDEASLLTPDNAPDPGSSYQGSNTFMLCLLDYNMDGQDTPGPVNAPVLNMFGVNSYDLFQEASTTGYQSHFTFDDKLTLGTFNFRSSGESGTSNSGFNLVQFEYLPD
jgi:pimeloyl-ACP methyl ester carboxylesterase